MHMYVSIFITVGLGTHIKINRFFFKKHMLNFCIRKKMFYAA